MAEPTAKKRKPPPHAWKKGQSGNPKGGRILSPEARKAREINQIEFERITNKFLYIGAEGIKQKLKDARTPMIEKMLGTIILKAVEEGDVKRAEWIMARMLGKATERIQIVGQRESRDLNVSVAVNNSQPQLAAEMSMADLEAMSLRIEELRHRVAQGEKTLDVPATPVALPEPSK